MLRVHQFTPSRCSLSYSDGTRFHLDLRQSRIWASWPESLTLEDTATYLLGPALGFFLRSRGQLCLHGSAVAVGKRCVSFAGPAGSGKSTLAAALARQGAQVLSEDVTCLVERDCTFAVQPGYPRIRLWADSAEWLQLPLADLPLLTPNWDKRYLPLVSSTTPAFHATSRRLDAVYLLAPRSSSDAPASIGEIDGQAVLSELVANTYGNELLDRDQRAQEFGALGRLARSVPVRSLTLNADGGRLFEACDWIQRHAFA